jgi:hypothetical protein
MREVVEQLPPPIEPPSGHAMSDAAADAVVETAIRPIAERLNRHLEQEQLQEADATMRVRVPPMDFTLPVPPWEVYNNPLVPAAGASGTLPPQKRPEGQMKLVETVQSLYFGTGFAWSGAKLLEPLLGWTPFPLHLGWLVVEETLAIADAAGGNNDDAVEQLLVGRVLPEGFDGNSLVWKPDGLRVLNTLAEDEEFEGEIEPADLGSGERMISVLAKRKLEQFRAMAEGDDEGDGDSSGAVQGPSGGSQVWFSIHLLLSSGMF